MLLACSLVALALAGSPTGARDLETTLQDDAAMLHQQQTAVRATARQMAWLGVDRVRITAGWSALAPSPGSVRRPAFDARDSRAYPTEGWLRIDRAVKAAREAGMEVMLDVAFWAPRWAARRATQPPRRQRWAPDSREFGWFAEAVARRYSGLHPDPEHAGRSLPAVRLYTTWNEPNIADFLMPQWIRRGGRWVALSPHVYRAMHERAYDAIKRVSALNRVLVGGTTATRSRRSGQGTVAPLAFLRGLACVDERLQPLRIPECRGYRPLRADGYAHHPYSMNTTPGTSDPDPDAAPIADAGRLQTLLDALAGAGRLARRLDLYETEYGYETNPPDPTVPFGLEQQGHFMSWATYLAWRDPRTRMFAQFLLRDVPPRPEFQTGLFFADGAPKPAARAFRLPFWAQVQDVDGKQVVVLFGGVRPGKGRQVVRVEQRQGDSWIPVQVTGERCDHGAATFFTDHEGWFVRVIPYAGPATFRLAWQRDDGGWERGLELPVEPPLPLGPGARPELSG